MKSIKRISLVLCILFTGYITFAQQRTCSLDYRRTKCIYNLLEGKLNGDYISYHYNGNKKAEGRLINGYRTGKWIVWDSTGRKRMERIYKNPFEYERIFPAIPVDGPVSMLIKNQYKLEYDSNGIIKYDVLKAENAIWRHKVWRKIAPENNQVLFEGNMLFNVLKNLATAGKIQLFETIDDRFTTLLQRETIEKIFVSNNIDIVGFEVKEEHIFDMGKLLSEYRIIGICPIVKINKRTQQLFWVYYPDFRKYLGKVLINKKANASDIKTLDDLFIFRDFSSTIIKSTIDNPYDKFIADYPNLTTQNILNEEESIELTLIEAEHDIWVSLTK